MIKTYSELIKIPTFKERFQYLKLDGLIGETTFGHNRYLNQTLYHSSEWRRIRNQIILRDNGCDLAMPGRTILKGGQHALIHHINPITVDDILNRSPKVFDPENLITVLRVTHNAIHYGDETILIEDYIPREVNDTSPWKSARR